MPTPSYLPLAIVLTVQLASAVYLMNSAIPGIYFPGQADHWELTAWSRTACSSVCLNRKCFYFEYSGTTCKLYDLGKDTASLDNGTMYTIARANLAYGKTGKMKNIGNMVHYATNGNMGDAANTLGNSDNEWMTLDLLEPMFVQTIKVFPRYYDRAFDSTYRFGNASSIDNGHLTNPEIGRLGSTADDFNKLTYDAIYTNFIIYEMEVGFVGRYFSIAKDDPPVGTKDIFVWQILVF